MTATAITTRRRSRRWPIWLLASVVFAAGVAVLPWLLGLRSAPGFAEYPMLVRTDIPTAVSVAPNGDVWFTIEFSNAIGAFRNGRIERLPKGGQNLEPLGLAADGSGGAWFTDASARAIGRIASDGGIVSFPLSSPIARLGRLALAPDGAVWFADGVIASITRLRDGVFTPHAVGSDGAMPYGVAVGLDGTVWMTLQEVDKLGRVSTDGRVTTFDVPTRNSGISDVAVDRSGAVWFVELAAGKIGRFADGRFAEFPVPGGSGGLTALAAAPDGSIWFTEFAAGKLGRLRDGRITEFSLPRDRARPFGVAVDAANNVWYTDLGGWLGRLPAEQAKAR